jgi:hypothetical protein
MLSGDDPLVSVKYQRANKWLLICTSHHDKHTMSQPELDTSNINYKNKNTDILRGTLLRSGSKYTSGQSHIEHLFNPTHED